MKASSKRAALRSLKRVRDLLDEACEWRRLKGGGDVPGSIEMGVLIGLQDAVNVLDDETLRLMKFRAMPDVRATVRARKR